MPKGTGTRHDYAERAREVEQARALIDRSFIAMTNRSNRDDPRTRAWLEAIDRFYAALASVYAGTLQSYAAGELPAEQVTSEDLLEFLEANPYFFGSGYMKERVLTILKRRPLNASLRKRLLRVILDSTDGPQRREFLYYCRAARFIEATELMPSLRDIERNGTPQQGRKASMILAALQPDWDWRDVARQA